MPFLNIDPVALRLGPLTFRWYGLAYVVGILGWWKYTAWLSLKFPGITRKNVDDYVTWAILSIVVGGRLGYVLFYNPTKHLADPLEILQVWKGGMSFHGGLLGVILATVIYCRLRRVPFLMFSDLGCCGVPIGLFFGRIANFINGELFGRPTEGPWGMMFPHGGPFLRHPSQLYEAFSEGIMLFLLLYGAAVYTSAPQKRGFLSGLFFVGYGIARIVCEGFREPDVSLGYLAGGLTMGQLLSFPMLFLGGILILGSLYGRKEHA